jgi:RND family efflux transporter MFP subunit
MTNDSPSGSEAGLSRLRIDPARKQRGRGGPLLLVLLIAGAIAVAILVYFMTHDKDRAPVAFATNATASTAATSTSSPPVTPAKPGDTVLTVSGYVVPRERIEISPKFQATVESINVKKGDTVKKGDLIVLLEDREFRARLVEAQGRLAAAKANLANAEINLKRQANLAAKDVDSQRAMDDAQRARDAAAADVMAAEGIVALAQTYVDWCKISAPIDGTILEKLVDPNELVVPQSFGGRGPSTAFVAMADLTDLQVEIDVNESDLAKVKLNQRCRISPEAYPQEVFDGYVAEIAPEADRTKGTLEVKVQVKNPNGYLTPELTAKVEFLAD